jgi:cell division initiation protein
MPITPVEIRHLTFKRAFDGYRRSQIDRALAEIAESFEQVWRQRADLADRIEELEQEVKRHVELEALLRSTLVSAERAASDMKEQARREAELIVTESQAKAREIMRDAIGEKERLLGQARRIQAMLRTALEVVEQEIAPAEGEAPAEVGNEPTEGESDPAVRRLAG